MADCTGYLGRLAHRDAKDQPQFVGQIEVAGERYEVGAWLQEKGGATLAFTPARADRRKRAWCELDRINAGELRACGSVQIGRTSYLASLFVDFCAFGRGREYAFFRLELDAARSD